ncbi:DUF1835 domain-containing protein [Bacillus sp. M6-12]|uniref:DUF1835 domain-containing protein n=1 Tax=Bacillus sp. M6-12 TaxID=2054166 RepID=UPI0015E0AAB2|nr:DUF1835 domain-containing protein [Bacillus sp. M6-12]
MVFEHSIYEERERPYKKAHILFGLSQGGSLKAALKDLNLTGEEKVISFPDIFSVGPITNMHTEAGLKARYSWVKKNFHHPSADFHEFTEMSVQAVRQIESLPDRIPITIWYASNAHEQIGLRYVMHLLREKTNEVFVINTKNTFEEYFNSPDLHYSVLHSGEISPEKLTIIYKRNAFKHRLSMQDRLRLNKEWLYLASTTELLRIWRAGEISSVPENYFDSFIVERAKYLHSKRGPKDFMKSARLIGEVLGHLDQYVGDEFLEYRLKSLIDQRVFEFEGSLKSMRHYSVRLT